MKLNKYLSRMYEIGEKYDVPPDRIHQVVEFQDFKRNYRGQKEDLEKSLEVVDRYLRIKNK